ncbi:hypothetical protein [Tahibacter harae]|uniref:Integral membrane protein n=1 Tax=Tahibacter harae TaxID=2963937 RepID=A0ABT1QRX8_9GAMM|nr:hypothetical protein [Tahibacter harae]MCQ4165038.1 hypothetical protein [Tahibacter harae]
MPASGQPIPCVKPQVDPADRSQLQMAGGVLYVFALLWTGMSTLAFWAAFAGGAEPPEAGGIAAMLLFFVCGLGLLLCGALLKRRVRLDDRRRSRLAGSGLRIPARHCRVVTESIVRNRRRRDEYRVVLLFTAPDGRDYEAWSDRRIADPAPQLVLERLRVLLDAEQAPMSMVAEDSLALP